VGHISVSDEGGVALVRTDRPPVNALDEALLAEGIATAEGLAADPPPAVVLAGRPGSYSAGLDLKIVPSLDEAARTRMMDLVNRMFHAWYGLPCPVVCAVTGHAIAGGLIHALCADYRVAASEGKLGLTEVRVGVPYPEVAMIVVAAELTPRARRLLALTNRLIDPDAALALGVVDEVVEPELVVGRALEVGRELAALPADVYAQTKLQLRRAALAEADAVLSHA
jgi:enoyl-CoA hydratase